MEMVAYFVHKFTSGSVDSFRPKVNWKLKIDHPKTSTFDSNIDKVRQIFGGYLHVIYKNFTDKMKFY